MDDAAVNVCSQVAGFVDLVKVKRVAVTPHAHSFFFFCDFGMTVHVDSGR